MSPLLRWGKFNAVGALGVAVQLTLLALLKSAFGLHYLAATALAVEAAVLHNFYWHQRWTWADRPRGSIRVRLLRFNLTTGAVSILSNVVLMGIFAGALHLHFLVANLAAIAITSILNYLLADWLVFV
ncbi:MAG: GtrA family protein [Acidobacteria bacterium]|nr:GtrA family protein [Acidobacteriota bacterium]